MGDHLSAINIVSLMESGRNALNCGSVHWVTEVKQKSIQWFTALKH